MRSRGTDWRARVLTAVDAETEAMVSTLTDLVRVPSIGGTAEENSVQADLARLLDAEGLEVDHWQVGLDELLASPGFPGVEVPRQEAWGVVGRLPGQGDGRSLMLNAHVDVVPVTKSDQWRCGPFSGAVVDGVLHGRGACDMKGGLVSALYAVRALRRSGVPLRGDVLLAGVQGEEDGGLGTAALLARGWRADACVIPEPTSLDVVPANAGALTFRLTIHGLATHASRHLEGTSAIGKLWPIYAALVELERVRNTDVDPLVRRWELPYPICIGTVVSGVWASSVPDLLLAEGRLGVALDEPVEHARAALEEAVAAACLRDPWLRHHPVEVTWWGGQFAPGRVRADSGLVEAVRRAHNAVAGGGFPEVWGASYGSDLRLLEAAGVATVQYGPGDAALAHGPRESVPVVEVAAAARTLALLALEHCGVA